MEIWRPKQTGKQAGRVSGEMTRARGREPEVGQMTQSDHVEGVVQWMSARRKGPPCEADEWGLRGQGRRASQIPVG